MLSSNTHWPSDRFLGDQRASYNHKLSFYLRIGELGPQATTEDVILEGAGLAISAPIFAQGNSLPSTQVNSQALRYLAVLVCSLSFLMFLPKVNDFFRFYEVFNLETGLFIIVIKCEVKIGFFGSVDLTYTISCVTA